MLSAAAIDSAPTLTASPAEARKRGIDTNPAHIEHLVVVGHPSPDSFNHAVARAYADGVQRCGQSVVQRDLYAEGFDPLLKACERPEAANFTIGDDVRNALAGVERASAIVMVYPIWFGMPPAAIVGYVDRVLGAGLTPTRIRRNDRHDLLAGKQLVLLTTSGSTLPWLAARGQWYGLRDAFDHYLETIFSFAGCAHEHFDSIVTPLLPSYAAECLGRAEERARTTSAALLADMHRRHKELKLSSRLHG